MSAPNLAPKWKVTEAAPSGARVVQNMSFRDWGIAALVGGASIPFGMKIGGPARYYSTIMAATFGISGGFLLGFQRSYGRLVGNLPPE